MTFKPSIWYPIAAVLTVVNLVAIGFATGPTPPWHAATHAVLALAFGLWAYRLRLGTGRGGMQERLEAVEADMDDLEPLEADVTRLQQQLSEMQERLDFAERLLAQRQEPRRVEPER